MLTDLEQTLVTSDHLDKALLETRPSVPRDELARLQRMCAVNFLCLHLTYCASAIVSSSRVEARMVCHRAMQVRVLEVVLV